MCAINRRFIFKETFARNFCHSLTWQIHVKQMQQTTEEQNSMQWSSRGIHFRPKKIMLFAKGRKNKEEWKNYVMLEKSCIEIVSTIVAWHNATLQLKRLTSQLILFESRLSFICCYIVEILAQRLFIVAGCLAILLLQGCFTQNSLAYRFDCVATPLLLENFLF